ncbi:hypothetical protein OU682_18250 [Paracoccus sp. EF6]|uniref:Uncharacterized protein n=1 Tax=Paracoccus benzoatiresistens TaxID=2997341 RepID=A0ABT4J9G6_9RHOB|nr:hypothetical protein [Paracoccus sp. EF6]
MITGTAGAVARVREQAQADPSPGGLARLSYLNGDASAFQVLSDVASRFRHHLAEHLQPLRYARVENGEPARCDWDEAGEPIQWRRDSFGRTVAFQLSPLAASNPLLSGFTQALAARQLDDEQSFSLLNAAFDRKSDEQS